MKISFEDKIAVITGATRGIGKAIANTFLTLGAEIYVTGTKADEIQKLNDNAKINGISRLHFLQVDFNDEVSTEKFIEEIKKLPKVDICVNNAGINIINDFCNIDFEEFLKIQKVNVFGPRKLLGAVVPKMKAQHYGRIVNIASIWSVINRPGRTSYGISKNAIVGMTKSISVELAEYGIMANAVSPGFTMTELTKRTNTVEQLEQLRAKIPARRLATPQEQANIVAFLCSELNSYMTGQNIIVDGGYVNE